MCFSVFIRGGILLSYIDTTETFNLIADLSPGFAIRFPEIFHHRFPFARGESDRRDGNRISVNRANREPDSVADAQANLAAYSTPHDDTDASPNCSANLEPE